MITTLALIVLAQQVSTGPGVQVRDEGVILGRALNINCSGAGVTCSKESPTTMTISVSGGGGGGSVTSVTASSPLSSSGGATPDISLTGTVSQARGGTGAGALTCSAGQALTSNGTLYSCTSTLTASDVACAGTCVADAEIAAVAGAKVTGSVANATLAAAATALAANPADCSAGQYATTIAANGDLTCAQVATSQLSGTVTNTQLASTYSGVGTCTNQFARVLNGNAAPTCATVALGSDVSGTLLAANGGLGAAQPTCAAGDFLTCNGTTCSCGTPGGGGGGSANTMETSLTLTGAGFFSTTVTGLAWVTGTTKVACSPLGTTADGLTPEAIAVGDLGVSISDRSAGVGFKVNVFSPNGLAGTVRIHCTGA